MEGKWDERLSAVMEYPFDYKRYIEKRLREIEDLEERRFAKTVLLEGLEKMIQCMEEKYRNLEQRIYNETEVADQAEIPREEIQYKAVQNGSPYAEVVLEHINNKRIEDTQVEVNPLYRFAKEFSAIFDLNLEGYEQTRALLFDVVMHYMVQLDLRQGLSKQEYALRFLLTDLLTGVCGKQAAQAILYFEKKKLRRLLRMIFKLYRCGSSISLFREVMRCIYPDSLVYASNDRIRQVLVYIGTKDTPVERARIAFLQDMFLPIYFQVFLFWEHHFGIIEIAETMRIDDMVLF